MNANLFHPDARDELVQTAKFYEREAPGLGQAFLDEVGRTIVRIVATPNSGIITSGGARRKLVRRFPFSVVYQPVGEDIAILAVMHNRRRPGYWRDRMA